MPIFTETPSITIILPDWVAYVAFTDDVLAEWQSLNLLTRLHNRNDEPVVKWVGAAAAELGTEHLAINLGWTDIIIDTPVYPNLPNPMRSGSSAVGLNPEIVVKR